MGMTAESWVPADRHSGARPAGQMAQHRQCQLHRLCLPGNKRAFYTSAEGLPDRDTQGNEDVPAGLTSRCLHHHEASVLPSPHSSPKPWPFSAEFSKALTTDILQICPRYVSMFWLPHSIHVVHKSRDRTACLFCSLMCLQNESTRLRT